jgi:FHA domain
MAVCDVGMSRYRLRLNIQEIDLRAGETSVGRGEDCTITLEDTSVSRRHALIHVRDGQVTIEDLGSRNGTKVNGNLIGQRVVLLRDADRLLLGSVQLIASFFTPGERGQRITGFSRACPKCGELGVALAPTCARCGVRLRAGSMGSMDIPTPVAANERQGWWLELQCELLDRAASLGRQAECVTGAKRIMAAVDGATAEDTIYPPEALSRAFAVITRVAVMGADWRLLEWVLRKVGEATHPLDAALVRQLLQVPPILLHDAKQSLTELFSSLEAHGVDAHMLAPMKHAIEST